VLLNLAFVIYLLLWRGSSE